MGSSAVSSFAAPAIGFVADEVVGRKKEKKKEEAARSKAQGLANFRSDLLTAVEEDETISDVTREELTGQLSGINPGSGEAELNRINKIFSEAQEGISPKFKARQRTQALFETLIDQPGRKQSLGAGRVARNNNTLLG